MELKKLQKLKKLWNRREKESKVRCDKKQEQRDFYSELVQITISVDYGREVWKSENLESLCWKVEPNLEDVRSSWIEPIKFVKFSMQYKKLINQQLSNFGSKFPIS